MKKEIMLLDCTLRDGGYVNDWDFGHSVITGTFKRLDSAGIDIIEVGFLDDRRPFDINRTIMPNTNAINTIYGNIKTKNAMTVAMIDFGTCSLENIGECKDTFIDGIRVIFKKEKINSALPFCKAIKEKGYKLFIQAISITSYSDGEMLNYVEKINEIKPYAFSIVDTYGLMHKDKLNKYFYLIDNNLDPSISLGYHPHNNFQLGYSNVMNIVELETNRRIIVDSTVYGMGKGAGNCCTELVTMHLNSKYNKHYDISHILEIIDTDLMTIYEKHYWGYKYDFYISALNDCHPNYVQYLLDKKTLSIKDINSILQAIPKEKKLLNNASYIEQMYIDFQANTIEDCESYDEIKSKIGVTKVLLLGPGKTISTESEAIRKFISDNNPIILSTNFMTREYDIDFVFISNAKRYSKLADMGDGFDIKAKLIATSNISELDYPIDYLLNYESLIQKGSEVADNVLLILLNALLKMDIYEVYLGGFDGLLIDDDSDNYFERGYSFVSDKALKQSRNAAMSMSIKALSDRIKINFITTSLYNEKGEKLDKMHYI